jgi:hypothetical protein
MGGGEALMSTIEQNPWETRSDSDSKKVVAALKKQFSEVQAYRYNSASLRVRVIDRRFAKLTTAERDALVAPHLRSLPEDVQAEILMLLALTPEEAAGDGGDRYMTNLEFEDPSPSLL